MSHDRDVEVEAPILKVAVWQFEPSESSITVKMINTSFIKKMLTFDSIKENVFFLNIVK